MPIVITCMWTAPPGPLIVLRFRRSPYGTSMPGAGAVHHINSVETEGYLACGAREYRRKQNPQALGVELCRSKSALTAVTHCSLETLNNRSRECRKAAMCPRWCSAGPD